MVFVTLFSLLLSNIPPLIFTNLTVAIQEKHLGPGSANLSGRQTAGITDYLSIPPVHSESLNGIEPA